MNVLIVFNLYEIEVIVHFKKKKYRLSSSLKTNRFLHTWQVSGRSRIVKKLSSLCLDTVGLVFVDLSGILVEFYV